MFNLCFRLKISWKGCLLKFISQHHSNAWKMILIFNLFKAFQRLRCNLHRRRTTHTPHFRILKILLPTSEITWYLAISPLLNKNRTMAREYDHLFKLLIIGDSGKNFLLCLSPFEFYWWSFKLTSNTLIDTLYVVCCCHVGDRLLLFCYIFFAQLHHIYSTKHTIVFVYF